MRRFIIITGMLFILFSCDEKASFIPVPQLTEIVGVESLTEIVIIENAPLNEKKLKVLMKQYEKTHPRNWEYRSHHRLFVREYDGGYSVDNSKFLCSVYWHTNFRGEEREDYHFYKDRWHL